MTAKLNNEYIPNKQDIVVIDFNPSVGKEIRKRRPAVVISNQAYSKKTGFVAVCPITHGAKNLENILVKVNNKTIDGSVNPFQLHTFDFRKRNVQKIDTMDTLNFQKVVQTYQYIF